MYHIFLDFIRRRKNMPILYDFVKGRLPRLDIVVFADFEYLFVQSLITFMYVKARVINIIAKADITWAVYHMQIFQFRGILFDVNILAIQYGFLFISLEVPLLLLLVESMKI